MTFLAMLLLPLFSQAQSFERDIPRIHAYDFVTSKQFDGPLVWKYGGDKDRNLYYRGFGFTNYGPNDIIWDPPTDFLDTPSREFYFQTDDMARRDNYLWVTDYNGSGRTSDLFESVFVFFPRLNPMSVKEKDEHLEVTLPTSEKVSFIKKYRTLDSDILKEDPLDLNSDRTTRLFAQIHYFGKGLIIRADAKGKDPRLASKVQVIKGNLKPCILAGKDFWTQEGHPKFKFVNDKEALAFIQKECGREFSF